MRQRQGLREARAQRRRIRGRRRHGSRRVQVRVRAARVNVPTPGPVKDGRETRGLSLGQGDKSLSNDSRFNSRLITRTISCIGELEGIQRFD
jgi:hypothetical protein